MLQRIGSPEVANRMGTRPPPPPADLPFPSALLLIAAPLRNCWGRDWRHLALGLPVLAAVISCSCPRSLDILREAQSLRNSSLLVSPHVSFVCSHLRFTPCRRHCRQIPASESCLRASSAFHPFLTSAAFLAGTVLSSYRHSANVTHHVPGTRAVCLQRRAGGNLIQRQPQETKPCPACASSTRSNIAEARITAGGATLEKSALTPISHVFNHTLCWP